MPRPNIRAKSGSGVTPFTERPDEAAARFSGRHGDDRPVDQEKNHDQERQCDDLGARGVLFGVDVHGGVERGPACHVDPDLGADGRADLPLQGGNRYRGRDRTTLMSRTTVLASVVGKGRVHIRDTTFDAVSRIKVLAEREDGKYFVGTTWMTKHRMVGRPEAGAARR